MCNDKYVVSHIAIEVVFEFVRAILSLQISSGQWIIIPKTILILQAAHVDIERLTCTLGSTYKCYVKSLLIRIDQYCNSNSISMRINKVALLYYPSNKNISTISNSTNSSKHMTVNHIQITNFIPCHSERNSFPR